MRKWYAWVSGISALCIAFGITASSLRGKEPEEAVSIPDAAVDGEYAELLEGEIQEGDFPFGLCLFSDCIKLSLGEGSFKKSLIDFSETALSVKQGHKNSRATININFNDIYSGNAEALYIKVDAASQTENSLIKFILKTDDLTELKSGGIYYLIDSSEKTYKLTHSSNRSCSIPAGFSGDVVLPISEYEGINPETVKGVQIQFQAVEKDENKKITFSEFKFAYPYISASEVYDEAFVSKTSVSETAFPYNLTNLIVADSFNSSENVSTLGGYPASAGKTYEGRVRLCQVHTNKVSGVRVKLNSSLVGYGAVSVEVDNTENGDSWISFLVGTEKGASKLKENAEIWLISKYDEYFEYKNLNETRAVLIPAGFKGKVVIPLDCFENATLSEINSLMLLLSHVSRDESKSIYLDDLGFIPTELVGAQIRESSYDFVGLETETVADMSVGVPLYNSSGIRADYYNIENGKLRIICGHTGSEATVSVGYGGDPENKIGISFDLDASELGGASYIKFMLDTENGEAHLSEEGYYFLYSDGKYYKYKHYNNYSSYIPKGFNGKVILPFSQFVYDGGEAHIEARRLTGSLNIELYNVVKNKQKSLYFDNFEYILNKQDNSGKLLQIPLGGGGYVTGIYIHPKDNSVKYIRTDMGGAYRWDEETNTWIQFLDCFGTLGQQYCVDGMALDPEDTDILYICVGDGNGTGKRGIYKSYNRGESFEYLTFASFFGNNVDRDLAECLVVDPNNSDVIYCGTRNEGLLYSRDAGKTWGMVSSDIIPTNNNGARGIRSVAIDSSETVNGRSKTIYVSGYTVGVYFSTDGGESWSKIDALPDTTKQMRVVNSTLYLSSDEGLFTYKNGVKTDITPTPDNPYFNALDVDGSDPNRIIVCRDSKGAENAHMLPIYYSSDGGKTWETKSEFKNIRKLDKLSWWPDYYFSSMTACLKFNPHKKGEVWMTDWYGVWVTYDIDDSKPDWYSKVLGHEEAVIKDSVSLPEGPFSLIIGTYDNGKICYSDITKYPERRMLGDTADIAYQYSDPGFVVFSCVSDKIYVSYDYGNDTVEVPSGVKNTMGAAISATDKDNILVIGWGDVPYYTKDGGKTWHQSSGATANEMKHKSDEKPILEPDGKDGNVFYYSGKDGLYRSDNGGESFTLVSTDFSEFAVIYTAPGKEGWVYAVDENGNFYKSIDFGETFVKVKNITSVDSISFGKGKTDEYALYAVGEHNGVYGLYISDNYGETWELMKRVEELNLFKDVEGDMQEYGTCYLFGRGLGAKVCYK